MNKQVYSYKDTNFLVKSALVAAIYAVLTLMLPMLSYGPIQLRFSEIMVLLVFYNRRFVPGLVLGCMIANLASPIAFFDVIFGSLASYIAFQFIQRQKNLFVASLFQVLSMVIPALLTYLLLDNSVSFIIMLLQFMASEFIVVSILGVIIFKILEKKQNFMNYILAF
jgi:uncharacterized membrane protein